MRAHLQSPRHTGRAPRGPAEPESWASPHSCDPPDQTLSLVPGTSKLVLGAGLDRQPPNLPGNSEECRLLEERPWLSGDQKAGGYKRITARTFVFSCF